MKKLIALFSIIGFLTFGMANVIFAQNNDKNVKTEETTVENEEEAVAAAPLLEDGDEVVEQSLHYVLKDKFIQGGALWMSPILICLVLGFSTCY